MLKQRILTALILLAVLLPALFSTSPWPFAALTLLFVAAAGWEWSRLNGQPGGVAWVLGLVLGLGCLAAWQAGWVRQAPQAVWWLAAVILILGGAWALRAGPQAWPRVPRLLRQVLGLVALWVAWLAMAQARHQGVNFVLSVMALVWAADIAAYAGGRAFGRHKLAPAISPGKTWEGAVSGALAVVVLALAWRAADAAWAMDSSSLYSRLWKDGGTVVAVGACLALAAMSVAGDLIESLVKRAAGAKDSSGLLPGHGGVLDRVDALLPVFPLALALAGPGAG